MPSKALAPDGHPFISNDYDTPRDSSPDHKAMHPPVRHYRSRDRTWLANTTGDWHGCIQANATSEDVRETDTASYEETFPDRSHWRSCKGLNRNGLKWMDAETSAAPPTFSTKGFSDCETISFREAIQDRGEMLVSRSTLLFSAGGWLSSACQPTSSAPATGSTWSAPRSKISIR